MASHDTSHNNNMATTPHDKRLIHTLERRLKRRLLMRVMR
jgi:hypothetical protein